MKTSKRVGDQTFILKGRAAICSAQAADQTKPIQTANIRTVLARRGVQDGQLWSHKILHQIARKISSLYAL